MSSVFDYLCILSITVSMLTSNPVSSARIYLLVLWNWPLIRDVMWRHETSLSEQKWWVKWNRSDVRVVSWWYIDGWFPVSRRNVKDGVEVRQSADKAIWWPTTRYKRLAEADESLHGSALYGKLRSVYPVGYGRQVGRINHCCRRRRKILWKRGDGEDNSDVCGKQGMQRQDCCRTIRDALQDSFLATAEFELLCTRLRFEDCAN